MGRTTKKKEEPVKGKNVESLENSQKIRSQFLAEMGGFVPESILLHDKADKAMDLIVEDERGYQECNTTAKKIKNKTMRKAFQASGQTCRGKGGGLSRFPQNIGRILVKLHTKKGDTYYDPFCVSGDSLISLPEGDFPIKELVGKECYVYCSDGNEMKIRKATDIRKTRTSTKVVRVHFKWGFAAKQTESYIDLTPDHLLMTRDGEWVKAKDSNGLSLMPLYRNIQHGRWVVKVKHGDWRRQARFIYEEITGRRFDAKKFNVHHKDHDKLNDSFDNFELQDVSEHGKHHHPKGTIVYTPTVESRANLSKAMTGNGNPFYGKKHNDTTKDKIGESAKNRNVGRTHTDEAIQAMCEKHRGDRSYIVKVQRLLAKGDKTHRQIAAIVGVHKNTVGNIARDRFAYNHKVTKVEYLRKRIDVYNMEVEEFHNFVANGVVVHNCGHNSRMELAYSLERNYVGVDVSEKFMDANEKIKGILLDKNKQGFIQNKATIKLIRGSSASVPQVKSNSADFTLTSPPYWDLEYYGDEPEQLGKNKTYDSFLRSITNHIEENFRILKPGSFCCWCINDFSKDGVFYTYHSDLIDIFKKVGFIAHAVYVLDLGTSIGACFVQSILQQKRLPKRHEYCIVFRKPEKEK